MVNRNYSGWLSLKQTDKYIQTLIIEKEETFSHILLVGGDRTEKIEEERKCPGH